MATEASKARRAARHADEKVAKAAKRILAPYTYPPQQEIESSERYEKMRNLPRGQWLNGKLFRNSSFSSANRPGNHTLHEEAEAENHARSVAAHVPEVIDNNGAAQ